MLFSSGFLHAGVLLYTGTDVSAATEKRRRMRAFLKAAGLTGLGLVLMIVAGCSAGNPLLRGPVFTWVKIPMTTDLNRTPVLLEERQYGSILHIEEPFSGYGMYAEIDTNGVGAIARKHGLKTIYFADREIFSILGVWRTETVHVYGEK